MPGGVLLLPNATALGSGPLVVTGGLPKEVNFRDLFRGRGGGAPGPQTPADYGKEHGAVGFF